MKKNNAVAIFALSVLFTLIFAAAAEAAPPVNDNFANAEQLNGWQVHITRTNIEATKETGEPGHASNAGGKSVWFKWSLPSGNYQLMRINLNGSSFDTTLAVYTGQSVNNLTGVRMNNDILAPSNKSSSLVFHAFGGVTYYIAVDGFAAGGQTAEQGAIKLDITPYYGTLTADYDADGRTDLSVFRPSNGSWFVNRTAGNDLAGAQFGAPGDIPVPADYDGDGKTDFAVYRPSNGTWYAMQSVSGFTARQWGANGDIPVAMNRYGETRATIAVFRPSNGFWYMLSSINSSVQLAAQWGANGDIPVPGNYKIGGNVDLRDSLAVFRPSTGMWYINSINAGWTSRQFGASGDRPVPGDYDADGYTDIAVFRPSNGTWYILRSSDNQFQAAQFGAVGDIPAPGDYNGDGKFDYAVFRPSIGAWIIAKPNGIPAQNFDIYNFGQNGDIPVTSINGK